MAHHVGLGEVDEADPLDALQDPLGLHQAALGGLGEVDLGDVAGDHHLGVEPHPGQEHLHLLGGSVLGLVEDDEGVVQGAAAHEGQRRDLDYPRLQVVLETLRVDHVEKGIVERPQVGVHLGLQVAGQKAEPLPGLHRRPGEDDALDVLGLQGGDRHRYRQVGLAGPGGADAEGDVVLGDGLDVAALPRGLGAEALGEAIARGLGLGFGEEALARER